MIYFLLDLFTAKFFSKSDMCINLQLTFRFLWLTRKLGKTSDSYTSVFIVSFATLKVNVCVSQILLDPNFTFRSILYWNGTQTCLTIHLPISVRINYLPSFLIERIQIIKKFAASGITLIFHIFIISTQAYNKHKLGLSNFFGFFSLHTLCVHDTR